MGQTTSRWDFLKSPKWGFPESTTGPKAPRPPTPGLHLPPGTHIPDWRQYKVEDVPQLLEVQKRLAARGLKDNWLRNEVWRLDQRIFGTKRWRIWGQFAPGMLYGLAMFAVVVFCEETILKDNKKGHDSHH